MCVCLCVCHDVCPNELTMRNWCHTNILQTYRWGCLIGQVMCYILMASSITSPDQKVCQILNCHNSVNFHRTAWKQILSSFSTVMFRFRFRFERSPKVDKRTIFRNFKIHVLHMIASIWLQILKLYDKWCKMKTTMTSQVTSEHDFAYCPL